MSKEEEYKLTLLHVGKWLSGDGFLDSYKPVNAAFANRIAEICFKVADGITLGEAIKQTDS